MSEAMGLRDRFTGWVGSFSKAAADVLPVRVGGLDFSRDATPAARVPGYDLPLLWVTVALLVFGLVMVYSASIAMPDNPKFARYAHTHFLTRHAVSLVVAAVAALIAFQIPLSTWEKIAPWLFVASIVLLIAVLIPHVGKGVNGARRWISLGIMNFQPSELAKFAVLLYAAGYMVRRMEVKERFFRAVLPMAVSVGLVGMLLLAEPDMGAFMVIAVIAMGILFLGGVNARMFFLIAAVIVFAFAMIVMTSEWRRDRIFAYLDPWSEKHALIDCAGPRRSVWCGPGGQRRKTALAARSTYRFFTRRDRRRVWPDWCGGGDPAVLLAHPPHHPHRPPGHRPGPRVCGPGGAGCGHLDGFPGLHQHGCEPRRTADQRPDPAAHELRRLGDSDEPGGDCGGAAD